MRVTFVPKNIDASGWYRCFFPAHELCRRGHVAKSPAMAFYRPDGSEASLVNGQLPDGFVRCEFAREWPDADVFVVQMPLDEGWPQKIDVMHQHGKKVVVELDDDYTCVPAYNPFATAGDRVQRLSTLNRCVQKADALSVSTPSIAKSYKHLNKQITVLRNRLHWDMWADVTPVYEQAWRRVRVGWMGILEYHRADLDVVKPWLSKWLQAHPEVEFVAGGDDGVHDYLGVPGGQRVTTSQVDFRHLELPDITAVFDVGLVPLAKNRFNEGKSYLKGMEYSACGIVPVCTPTGQYREFVRAGVDGEMAEGSREWQAVLEVLVGDAAKRKRMGGAARAKAQLWTYESHIGEWEDFYRGLSPKPRLLWGDGDNAVAAGERIAA